MYKSSHLLSYNFPFIFSLPFKKSQNNIIFCKHCSVILGISATLSLFQTLTSGIHFIFCRPIILGGGGDYDKVPKIFTQIPEM